MRASTKKKVFAGRMPVVWQGQIVGSLAHCALDGATCTGRWLPGSSDGTRRFLAACKYGTEIRLVRFSGRVLSGAKNGEMTVAVELPVG
jgi:hypothetical protein